MKYSVILLLLVFSFGQLKAQSDNEKYMKYVKWKKTGTGLTIGGSVLTVVGIALVSSANFHQTTNQYTGQSSYTSSDPNAVSGVLCLLGGAGMLGAGIPLMVIGSKKSKRYQPAAMSLNLNVAPNYERPRVELSLRF